MLTIEFSKATVKKGVLNVGCVIRYGEGGPVRFVVLRVDENVLDWESLDALLTFASRATNRYLDRERETEEDAALPGM